MRQRPQMTGWAVLKAKPSGPSGSGFNAFRISGLTRVLFRMKGAVRAKQRRAVACPVPSGFVAATHWQGQCGTQMQTGPSGVLQ
jgi:hypothetical protein